MPILEEKHWMFVGFDEDSCYMYLDKNQISLTSDYLNVTTICIPVKKSRMFILAEATLKHIGENPDTLEYIESFMRFDIDKNNCTVYEYNFKDKQKQTIFAQTIAVNNLAWKFISSKSIEQKILINAQGLLHNKEKEESTLQKTDEYIRKTDETVFKVVKQPPNLSIDIIFNNPFRILGLPVNATEREIAKHANDLKMYVEMGKVPKVKLEITCFPSCERTSDSIEEAKKKIERSENRLLYSFFWYSNEGINRLALDVLSEGNTEKAMELWGKVLNKHLAGLDNIEKNIQPTDGEIDDAIVDNILIPYLEDNYEIDYILSDIFNARALRDALKFYTADIREGVLHSNDNCYYVVSDEPIGVDDNGEEMELDIEIEKTSINSIIENLSGEKLALPANDFLCAKNLMVLYLGLAFKENELNCAYFSKSLHLAGRVFRSSKPLGQYAASFDRHDNGELVTKLYIDEILKCVKPLLDDGMHNTKIKEIAKSFGLFPDTFRKDAIAELTYKPIQAIKKRVAETAEKRKKNPLEANKYGEELYINTYEKLLILKDILLTNNLQYQKISYEVADELESCFIDFFTKNKGTENNIDPGDDALKLAKYATSIAIDTRIKDRISTWMPVLEEWVKDKPIRERRKKAEPHIDYIVKQLNGLPGPDKVSSNELIVADRFLEKCTTSLNSLRSILAVDSRSMPSITILEQFEDNENKWSENVEGDFTKKIEDGKYILTNENEKSNYWTWGLTHLNFSNFPAFNLECSVTKIKGDDDEGYGIVWSFQKKGEDQNYFIFCVTGDGRCWLREYNQGQWLGGFAWMELEQVAKGNETNILTVRRNTNSIDLYINDKPIVVGEKISLQNMTGTGIGFWVGSNLTIGINYLYFCNAYISDFRTIFDYNYYMSLSSAVASRTLDYCIAYANRTGDMEKPIMLMNKIQQIDMAPELRKRFDSNENILKSNLRIKEANTPPLIKLFKKVSKWL